MKTNRIVWVTFLALQGTACGWFSHDFEMKVDRVDELNGFILKGTSITGKVTVGCIANADEYIVKRSGKEVFRTTTRIVNVEGLQDPDAFTGKVFRGDYVTFYIPGGKLQDVRIGDLVMSKTVSCKKDLSKNTGV